MELRAIEREIIRERGLRLEWGGHSGIDKGREDSGGFEARTGEGVREIVFGWVDQGMMGEKRRDGV